MASDGIWPQGPKFTRKTQYYYTNGFIIHFFKHEFNQKPVIYTNFLNYVTLHVNIILQKKITHQRSQKIRKEKLQFSLTCWSTGGKIQKCLYGNGHCSLQLHIKH